MLSKEMCCYDIPFINMTIGSYPISVEEQGMNMTLDSYSKCPLMNRERMWQYTVARINLLTNRPFVWWSKSIHKLHRSKRMKVTLELCKADDGKLSHSSFTNTSASTPLSEAFHAARSFVYLPASLLKVKSSNLPTVSLACSISWGGRQWHLCGRRQLASHSQPVSWNP